MTAPETFTGPDPHDPGLELPERQVIELARSLEGAHTDLVDAVRNSNRCQATVRDLEEQHASALQRLQEAEEAGRSALRRWHEARVRLGTEMARLLRAQEPSSIQLIPNGSVRGDHDAVA